MVLARKDFWGSHSLKHWCFTFSTTASSSWLFAFTSFGSRGIIGQYLAPLGIDFAFNWKGAVLASAVMGFPLLVQSIRLAIELVDQRLEMAAKTLGASSLGAFFHVTLPLASSGILIGAILCFCRSLGSLGPPLLLWVISQMKHGLCL